jgi:hypothetical protein
MTLKSSLVDTEEERGTDMTLDSSLVDTGRRTRHRYDTLIAL